MELNLALYSTRPTYRTLQLGYRLDSFWLDEGRDLADGLLSLLLNSLDQDLAGWDILDDTHNRSSSPNSIINITVDKHYTLLALILFIPNYQR